MASPPLSTYKTPGVYVQEIRKLPPSIAQVDTAIPVFIGYTEKAERNGESITNIATRVQSLGQYVNWFGNAQIEDIQLGVNFNTVTGENEVSVVSKTAVDHKMSYALQMYFANGGGACYIISVGSYSDPISGNDLQSAIDLLKYEPEPTLIVFPDAVDALGGAYLSLIKAALQHCNDPKITNRFVIADVKQEADPPNNDITPIDDALAFRTLGASLDEYKYGAAYYPYLKTTLVIETTPANVTIAWHKENGSFKTPSVEAFIDAGETFDAAAFELQIANQLLDTIEVAQDIADTIIADNVAFPLPEDKMTALGDQLLDVVGQVKKDELILTAIDPNNPGDPADPTRVQNAINAEVITLTSDRDQKQTTNDDAETAMDAAEAIAEATLNGTPIPQRDDLSMLTLAQMEQSHNGLYNNLLLAVDDKCRLTLPPSSAMAGIYATVDSTRGVFKSPANVGITNVIGPAVKISDDDNDTFNVDTNGGKSINVIRVPYPGSGTLVWGARTLAGNDREWRYVSVRRFFSMVEESTKRALRQFVFEANNKNTWVSVRAAIESFLETQWRAGALLGNTPEDAYTVRVGMPETFTEAEMLDGYMVVEIGMAVVRPAEFIVLRFMHQFDLGQS